MRRSARATKASNSLSVSTLYIPSLRPLYHRGCRTLNEKAAALMTKQEILLAHEQYLFPSVFHYFKEPLVIERAKDQFVWDADGNQNLDFFGGIVTISVGHCNDAVNQKVKAQIDKLEHVSTAYITEPQAKLAQRVAGITPGGALSKMYFTNSGTEANETAFLTARLYTSDAADERSSVD